MSVYTVCAWVNTWNITGSCKAYVRRKYEKKITSPYHRAYTSLSWINVWSCPVLGQSAFTNLYSSRISSQYNYLLFCNYLWFYTSSEIMKEIKKHGAHKELRWRYTEALILGLLVIFFFTILGAIIDETNSVSNVLVSVSTGILVSYTCSVISTCYYLLSIIGLINEDRQGPENTPSTPKGKFR